MPILFPTTMPKVEKQVDIKQKLLQVYPQPAGIQLL
jgi:hypothetical protein